MLVDQIINGIVPKNRQLTPYVAFSSDESKWFDIGHSEGIVSFQPCESKCDTRRKRGEVWADEFVTPNGQRRHLLFGGIGSNSCTLSREYIPHIAAVSRLIVQKGFDRQRYSFSRYRTFSRDIVTKKLGGGYETDAEFYGPQGDVFLHVEAKASMRDVEVLAAQLDSRGQWGALQAASRKELEYVLDLTPKYLWLVGPGSIDPELYVYRVQVDGNNACFTRETALPLPPGNVL